MMIRSSDANFIVKNFRRGVCALIRARDGRILQGERTNEPGRWQLPQGGIDKGESAEAALHREVEEEVGVTGLKIEKQTEEYIGYIWPDGLYPDSKFTGQVHLYFLLDGSHIDLSKLKPTPEFRNFRWATEAQLVADCIAWKKDVYRDALTQLLKD